MSVDGYEAIGGLRFRAASLPPGAKISFVLIMAIMEADESESLIREYGSLDRFDAWLGKTNRYWKSKLEIPRIHTGDARYEGWLRWVTIQPVLRRIFGIHSSVP